MGKLVKVMVGLVLALSLVGNGVLLWQKNEQYRVTKVTDGDTFWIKSGDRVRLLGVNAPEIGRCGSEEATQKLTSLVLNKIIKIQEEKRDEYGRRMGLVYSGNTLVNLEMVRSGWARINYDSNSQNEALKLAWKDSVENKLGVNSKQCKNSEGPSNGCVIKGNIDKGTGDRFYHLPKCRHYNQIVLDTDLGEGYFCSEAEASAAGFTLAPDCLR